MDLESARYLVKSLMSKLVALGNDQWQFDGTITSLEREALLLLIGERAESDQGKLAEPVNFSEAN